MVEIDKSKFYNRKDNKRQLLTTEKDGWVFGGIQRSKKGFYGESKGQK